MDKDTGFFQIDHALRLDSFEHGKVIQFDAQCRGQYPISFLDSTNVRGHLHSGEFVVQCLSVDQHQLIEATVLMLGDKAISSGHIEIRRGIEGESCKRIDSKHLVEIIKRQTKWVQEHGFNTPCC